jgi:protein TonB
MTLIPMMSAIIARPAKHGAPAGLAPFVRESYDPGAAHRPVAAAFAFGLPAALVIAVALSPMIVKETPRTKSQTWTDFTIEQPKPKPRPDPKPQTDLAQTRVTSVPTQLPPIASDPPIFDPAPPYVAPAGSGSGPAVADPPLPSKPAPFVVAQVDPRYAGSFQPDYPASEQRREIEGIVRVRVLIGTDGRVKAIELVSTDSQGFFEATKRRALTKWRFKPATRGGVAEESWKEMTVRFQIRGG